MPVRWNDTWANRGSKRLEELCQAPLASSKGRSSNLEGRHLLTPGSGNCEKMIFILQFISHDNPLHSTAAPEPDEREILSNGAPYLTRMTLEYAMLALIALQFQG